MSGLLRIVALTALVGVPEVCAGQEQRPRAARADDAPVLLTASAAAGWIEGFVTDDRSQPIGGAAVTAQGRDLLIIATDAEGRFALRGIAAGTYLMRVQGRGFAASRREFVQVLPSRGTRHDVQLRRAAMAAAAAPVEPRVIAAGMGGSQISAGADPRSPSPESPIAAPASVEDDDHDHSAVAWRLRHLKRPVLRDTTARVADGIIPADEQLWDEARFELRDWTLGLGRAAASAIGTTLSGRVQLLTTGAFDQPFEAFASNDVPTGIAHVNVGGPISAHTSWGVEAATSHGSVNSWFVGGSYATVLADSHGIELRSTYSRQRYEGANASVLAVFADESRNVGGVSISDHWTLTPRALVTVGGRYEHYDYLRAADLFSPSLSVALSPADHTWIRATVAQQMTAPGAEEFVPQAFGSFSLPPQRTFAPLVAGTAFDRQVTRHIGVAVEQDVASFRVGFRHFRQDVDDQLVTVFGVEPTDGRPRADLEHYSVATGGSFSASGWGVSVSRPVASHVRGSVEYRLSQASWRDAGDAVLGRWAPSALRGVSEQVHDLTTRVDAEVPVTTTRVLATYRFSTGYTRDDLDELQPGPDTRFEVQVYQGLPFLDFTSAKVELVFAVRNLFRDTRDDLVSVYDELLVVRPPKRVVGGVTVQF
jgi:TonB dependent receptor/Carboxypeptidase regulatory-like domain